MAEQSLIDLIKILRERTGAGLMDCKNALIESDNDLDKACDWLREKGLAKAAKKADRIAAEGLAITKKDPTSGKVVILEVNCETDFVSGSDAFKEFVDSVATTLLTKEPSSIDEAISLTQDLFTDATVKLGEKLSLRRFKVVTPKENQAVYTYIHMGGKIAVAVTLAKEATEEFGKYVAMHIASNSPTYVKLEDVPQEEIAREREIQTEATKNDEKLAGKPQVVIDRAIEGKVSKTFQESTLYEQAYFADETKKVKTLLKENDNDVINFTRYKVGEGIEKRQDDFVSEVLSQANS
ncbi:MAG: translation elongation factor Ts [Coprobacillus sp.]|nr:translation elongation factor Ts [Coprobacillus sp.]